MPQPKEYPQDAGWDVRAADSYALHPGQRSDIKTGLAIKLLPTTAQEQFAVANGL